MTSSVSITSKEWSLPDRRYVEGLPPGPDVKYPETATSETRRQDFRMVTPLYKSGHESDSDYATISTPNGTLPKPGLSLSSESRYETRPLSAAPNYKEEVEREEYRLRIIDPKVDSHGFIPTSGTLSNTLRKRNTFELFPSIHSKRSFLKLDPLAQLEGKAKVRSTDLKPITPTDYLADSIDRHRAMEESRLRNQLKVNEKDVNKPWDRPDRPGPRPEPLKEMTIKTEFEGRLNGANGTGPYPGKDKLLLMPNSPKYNGDSVAITSDDTRHLQTKLEKQNEDFQEYERFISNAAAKTLNSLPSAVEEEHTLRPSSLKKPPLPPEKPTNQNRLPQFESPNQNKLPQFETVNQKSPPFVVVNSWRKEEISKDFREEIRVETSWEDIETPPTESSKQVKFGTTIAHDDDGILSTGGHRPAFIHSQKNRFSEPVRKPDVKPDPRYGYRDYNSQPSHYGGVVVHPSPSPRPVLISSVSSQRLPTPEFREYLKPEFPGFMDSRHTPIGGTKTGPTGVQPFFEEPRGLETSPGISYAPLSSDVWASAPSWNQRQRPEYTTGSAGHSPGQSWKRTYPVLSSGDQIDVVKGSILRSDELVATECPPVDLADRQAAFLSKPSPPPEIQRVGRPWQPPPEPEPELPKPRHPPSREVRESSSDKEFYWEPLVRDPVFRVETKSFSPTDSPPPSCGKHDHHHPEPICRHSHPHDHQHPQSQASYTQSVERHTQPNESFSRSEDRHPQPQPQYRRPKSLGDQQSQYHHDVKDRDLASPPAAAAHVRAAHVDIVTLHSPPSPGDDQYYPQTTPSVGRQGYSPPIYPPIRVVAQGGTRRLPTPYRRLEEAHYPHSPAGHGSHPSPAPHRPRVSTPYDPHLVQPLLQGGQGRRNANEPAGAMTTVQRSPGRSKSTQADLGYPETRDHPGSGYWVRTRVGTLSEQQQPSPPYPSTSPRHHHKPQHFATSPPRDRHITPERHITTDRHITPNRYITPDRHITPDPYYAYYSPGGNGYDTTVSPPSSGDVSIPFDAPLAHRYVQSPDVHISHVDVQRRIRAFEQRPNLQPTQSGSYPRGSGTRSAPIGGRRPTKTAHDVGEDHIGTTNHGGHVRRKPTIQLEAGVQTQPKPVRFGSELSVASAIDIRRGPSTISLSGSPSPRSEGHMHPNAGVSTGRITPKKRPAVRDQSVQADMPGAVGPYRQQLALMDKSTTSTLVRSPQSRPVSNQQSWQFSGTSFSPRSVVSINGDADRSGRVSAASSTTLRKQMANAAVQTSQLTSTQPIISESSHSISTINTGQQLQPGQLQYPYGIPAMIVPLPGSTTLEDVEQHRRARDTRQRYGSAPVLDLDDWDDGEQHGTLIQIKDERASRRPRSIMRSKESDREVAVRRDYTPAKPVYHQEVVTSNGHAAERKDKEIIQKIEETKRTEEVTRTVREKEKKEKRSSASSRKRERSAHREASGRHHRSRRSHRNEEQQETVDYTPIMQNGHGHSSEHYQQQQYQMQGASQARGQLEFGPWSQPFGQVPDSPWRMSRSNSIASGRSGSLRQRTLMNASGGGGGVSAHESHQRSAAASSSRHQRRGQSKQDVRQGGSYSQEEHYKSSSGSGGAQRMHKSQSARDVLSHEMPPDYEVYSTRPIVEFPPTLPRNGDLDAHGGGMMMHKSQSMQDWNQWRGKRGGDLAPWWVTNSNNVTGLEREFHDTLLMPMPAAGHEKDRREEKIPGGRETFEKEFDSRGGLRDDGRTQYHNAHQSVSYKKETSGVR